MIDTLIVTLMMISIIFGVKNGTLSSVSAAAIDSCTKAVELTLFLAGSMALWGGAMRIAEKSGITKLFEKIVSPIVKHIFKDIGKDRKLCRSVCMNITANMFGLGNASTPLGIKAAKEFSERKNENTKRNISMLVVLNTASVQLIPTTVMSIRLAHGAQRPFDIAAAVLASSFLSAAVGCIFVHTLYMADKCPEKIKSHRISVFRKAGRTEKCI